MQVNSILTIPAVIDGVISLSDRPVKYECEVAMIFQHHPLYHRFRLLPGVQTVLGVFAID